LMGSSILPLRAWASAWK